MLRSPGNECPISARHTVKTSVRVANNEAEKKKSDLLIIIAPHILAEYSER